MLDGQPHHKTVIVPNLHVQGYLTCSCIQANSADAETCAVHDILQIEEC